MLSFLLGLIPSAFNTINSITSAISNAKIAQINATSDVEKASIQAKVDQLESQRDVLIADASQSKIDMIIRAMYAIPPALYFSKIFVYDKMLGWGTTDDLQPNSVFILTAVIGFYFLYSTVKLFR